MSKPFEVQIAHLSVEIELSLRTDRAVQHHVHHWGVDVKDLQTDDAVIEEVVAVHAREQCTRIAAAIEMHVSDSVGIVERPREFDDVVDVARDRLVGRDERRDILHARPHRVDLHIDAPLARKADRTVDKPDLAPIPLHRKIMDADARERALCAEDQAVKRLMHQLSARRRHLHLHVRIRDIAVHLAADVRESRKAETIIEAVQQGEIDMPAVKAEIERRSAADRPLDAEIRSMGKFQAEKINRQILAAQGKGRIRALDRHGTIHPIQHLCTAVNGKPRALRPLSFDAEIGRERTAEIRRERQLYVRPQAVKGQSLDLQVCSIG